MKSVVIVDSVRLAIGKLGGTLGNENVDFLGAKVIEELIVRTSLDKHAIEEVIMGQAKQSADVSNLARVAALRAGIPVEVPAYTVHRQCGSGVQAVNSAAQQIQTGLSDIIIAGGAESMSTAPYYVNHVRFGIKAGDTLLKDPNTASQPGSQPREVYGDLIMGVTAENIAEKYSISREEQDEFSLRSQVNAHNAITKGYFEKEIVPYEMKGRKGTVTFKVDEHPRETTLDKLASLKPVFKDGGTVTAGNSSGRNDGAAALLIMSEEEALKRGYKPKVRIIAQAAAGCSPEFMGMGPVHATLKALKQTDLTINDLDIIELNEAFAAQALGCMKELGLNPYKVNPNGGAIAMGHPIGATGAILFTKLIHELERTGKKYGLVTLCIAGGLGISTIVENLQV
ncbi:thiolase family protein [Neobacillus vireti]|uniref:acetyl-CoA C-acetyltransferase n=1 Tax=Neobacillus vireti LMG 21834 TaxID=1131730 RepID=A0AB94IFH3_9BACI|nr:thiolase family protein [Neobacillus vireti]ETI65861.1 acetyl-CoA acetyltransferase [Neobacillus vireti LMG 21834]KLT18101.1 acetyl-CoA acetyltransferase [Neobacillus vireti]